MEKWVLLAKRADFNALGERYAIDPVIARLIRNRNEGIAVEREFDEYLNGRPENMADPFTMKDMDKAVTIIRQKIADGAHLRVVGDYDIDGIMAAYILTTGLRSLGGCVDYTIPHRIHDGYGISNRIVEEALWDGIDTIITCDNGISAGQQVAYARELGMTVIVTDHHDIVSLPEADAVIDPKQPGCQYPFKQLCGAAVAWRLLQALEAPAADEMMEFAAFATIGDIVSLKGENRTLVRAGLERLRHTGNLGLSKLIEVNGLCAGDIKSYHIGFVLGPCLNASGRLSTALKGVRLLESQDEKEAEELAYEMKELNEKRKKMTEDGVIAAEKYIHDQKLENDAVYVIYLPDCHESVAGIIAGRIREKYTHPTFVLTDGRDLVKGSGRSTEAYSMIDGLKSCADLLEKFGGHPLAAGVSLKKENIEAFRNKLNGLCGLKEDDFFNKIVIDVAMPMHYVTEKLIRQLDILEPFGQDNPRPVFAMKEVRTDDVRIVGKEGNILQLKMREAGGFRFDAVYFRDDGSLLRRIRENTSMSVIYYPTLSEFRGEKKIKAVITHYI